MVLPPAEGAWLNISCFVWDRTMSILSLPNIPEWRSIFAPCCPRNLSNIVLTLGIATKGNRFFFWKLLGTWSIRTDARIPMCETAHVGGCKCNLRGFPTGGEDKKHYSKISILRNTYCKRKYLNFKSGLNPCVPAVFPSPIINVLVYIMNAFQSVNPSNSPKFLQPQICAILFCSELVLYFLLEMIWIN